MVLKFYPAQRKQFHVFQFLIIYLHTENAEGNIHFCVVLLTTVITWSKAQVRISWMVGSISYHRNRRVRRVENTASIAGVIRFCRSVLVAISILQLLVCSFSFGSTIGKPDLGETIKSVCQKWTSISLLWFTYKQLMDLSS